MRKFMAVALAFFVVSACQAGAGTILSISGANNGGYSIGGLTSTDYTHVVGFSFSLAMDYNDVAITVPLSANAGSDTVTAYLVRGSLPQADTSEVASVTFTTTALTTRSYSLFDGLSLAAGTYSLVLDSTTSSNNTLGWQYSVSPTIVQNDGVTYAAFTSLNETRPAYAPDSPNFQPATTTATLNILISGEVAPTAVPEPTAVVSAFAAVVIGLGVAARRRAA